MLQKVGITKVSHKCCWLRATVDWAQAHQWIFHLYDMWSALNRLSDSSDRGTYVRCSFISLIITKDWGRVTSNISNGVGSITHDYSSQVSAWTSFSVVWRRGGVNQANSSCRSFAFPVFVGAASGIYVSCADSLWITRVNQTESWDWQCTVVTMI